MSDRTYVLSYDIGTTGVKTCLFEVEDEIKLIAAEMEGYSLTVYPDGGAEQDPDEWWSAICNTTKRLMNSTSVSTSEIAGISFCSQMQGLVLVDKDGRPVRKAMSYMDQRAKKQIKELMAYGPQIAGAYIPKLLKSLQITGAVSASVKDPVYKYKWVEENEPENFARTYKWLDVKEYIICRMTDKFVMTRDSAFGTLLYDVRKGKEGWSPEMLKMFNVKPEHMAEIIDSTALVGGLTEKAADDLGLCEGTPVFGGGGDASLIGVGAGAVALGDTHIYCGTSGWVTTVVDKNIVDTSAMIAAIVGAQNGKLNYFAELETAGKCLEWVKDHLALDEIDIFLEKTDVASSKESIFTSLYDYMSHVINKTPQAAAELSSPRGCTATAARSRIRTPAECSSTSALRPARPSSSAPLLRALACTCAGSLRPRTKRPRPPMFSALSAAALSPTSPARYSRTARAERSRSLQARRTSAQSARRSSPQSVWA